MSTIILSGAGRTLEGGAHKYGSQSAEKLRSPFDGAQGDRRIRSVIDCLPFMLSPRSMSRFFNLRVPLRNRYERSRVWADIVSVGTDQPIVCALFYDMRRPTRNTRNHKERREHRSGDA